MSLELESDEVKLAVDLIYLLESNDVPPPTPSWLPWRSCNATTRLSWPHRTPRTNDDGGAQLSAPSSPSC